MVRALRVIDAAANRAAEGLRGVEDYLRFVLDDPHLTSRCKQLRHDLQAALAAIQAADRHAARDTLADIGTTIATPAEHTRADLWDACAASFSRASQSLRSLEEYAKVLSPTIGKRFEALRYQTYTLHRAVAITGRSADRLRSVRLLVLVDGCASTAQFSALVDRLVTSGVHAIQLRDKSLAARPLMERARQLRARTRATGTLMFVNDRPDVAVASHADGVHVGQDDLSVKDVRTVAGPELLIGVSTHSLEQARQAVDDGANLIGAGPTFHSSTKAFAELPGLGLLEAISQDIRLPVFAIGGIDCDNLAQVLGTGVQRVAVGAAITRNRDPARAARQLLEQLAVLRSTDHELRS
ncbi:MAG: thiamine-phosphate diphosphorylase [Planctomycetes bacterium RBG_16_64_10]|nr:MAG: thiamine-phosphate diphosphorylase [Planctomycetes bacterium RBG_16_64_10]